MSSNPFDTLNIEPSFFIDLKKLVVTYQELIKKVHPDQFKTNIEKEKALIMAIEINDSFQILSRPLKRAETLLHLKKIGIDQTCHNTELLEEMMALKEQNDKKLIQDKLQIAYKNFGIAFEENNNDNMKNAFLKMQYLEKMLKDKAKDKTCGIQN